MYGACIVPCGPHAVHGEPLRVRVDVHIRWHAGPRGRLSKRVSARGRMLVSESVSGGMRE